MSSVGRLLAICLTATAIVHGAAASDNAAPVGPNRSRLFAPSGDASFRPYVAYPVGSLTAALAIGDLNGDGRNDVAVVTTDRDDPANDNMLHVFVQTPTGTLERSARYFIGGRPTSVAVGDLNGDGRADVVVGNNSLIGVFYQNSAGSLDPMVSYPTANSSLVRVGDLNNDGRDDVVGTAFGTEPVAVFLQNAAGGLDPATTYSAPVAPQDLEIGDMNADGLTDIVVLSAGSTDPTLSILHQRAGGGFDPAVDVNLPFNQFRSGLGVGDLNGDGRNDAAISYGGNFNHFVARVLQMPGGGFTPPQSYDSYHIPTALEVADVDGDGRPDIVVLHSGALATGIYFQSYDGSLRAEELFDIPLSHNGNPHGIAVGDLDGDGITDIAHADAENGLVVLYQNSGIPPDVTITAPSGGPLREGVPFDIEWNLSGSDIQRVDVFDAHEYWNLFTPIGGCTALPPTATSCTWVPPVPLTTSGRLRVQATDASGNVGAAIVPYTLLGPVIAVTQPNTSVEWGIGSTRAITWKSDMPPGDTLDLALWRGPSSNWTNIAAAVPNSGSFDWRVTGPASPQCRIRASWTTDPLDSDMSDVDFSIAAPFMRVTAPNTNVGWTVGTVQEIHWLHNLGTREAADIELSRDGGASWSMIASGVAHTSENEGSYLWTVTGPATRRARVRVRWAADGTVMDLGDATFRIGPRRLSGPGGFSDSAPSPRSTH